MLDRFAAHKPRERLLAHFLLLLDRILGEAHAVAVGHQAYLGELGLQFYPQEYSGVGDLAVYLR